MWLHVRGFYYNRGVKPMCIYLIIYILDSYIFISSVCFPFKNMFPYCFPSIIFLFLSLLFSSELEDSHLIFILLVPSRHFLSSSSFFSFIENKLEYRVRYSFSNRCLLRDFHVPCPSVSNVNW